MLLLTLPLFSIPPKDILPLHFAAMGKNNELISELLQKQGYQHPKDENGATPLHYAAGMGNLVACQIIIKKFHDKNPYDIHLVTPLHIGT